LPLTVNAKNVPVATPPPLALQTTTEPLPPGGAVSTNVTIVVIPAVTVTLAVPVPRLLLTSNPALGKVLTLVSTVPPGMVSVTVCVPSATNIGVLQEPGAAPAGTMNAPVIPVTLKVKFVPTVTPPPATLQTCI
jgi:hypothetical protein